MWGCTCRQLQLRNKRPQGQSIRASFECRSPMWENECNCIQRITSKESQESIRSKSELTRGRRVQSSREYIVTMQRTISHSHQGRYESNIPANQMMLLGVQYLGCWFSKLLEKEVGCRRGRSWIGRLETPTGHESKRKLRRHENDGPATSLAFES